MRSGTMIAVLPLVLAACGTNRPEIPPELLALDGSSSNGSYPEGPYGASVGAVVENKIFPQGWINPTAAGYDPVAFEPISFGDFYDPTGEKYELLLVNTAAIWCSACKIEHGGSATRPSLNEHFQQYSPKGLVILSLLFEDNDREPAVDTDLQTWTRQFDTIFPMALDPEYQMKTYQPNKVLAPFNMIVDTRTMTILATFIGDQAAEIWPLIEQTLDERASGG